MCLCGLQGQEQRGLVSYFCLLWPYLIGGTWAFLSILWLGTERTLYFHLPFLCPSLKSTWDDFSMEVWSKFARMSNFSIRSHCMSHWGLSHQHQLQWYWQVMFFCFSGHYQWNSCKHWLTTPLNPGPAPGASAEHFPSLPWSLRLEATLFITSLTENCAGRWISFPENGIQIKWHLLSPFLSFCLPSSSPSPSIFLSLSPSPSLSISSVFPQISA